MTRGWLATGDGLENALLDAVWVGRFDRGWAAARNGSWHEGYYESRDAAIEAAEQFTDAQIRHSKAHLGSGRREPPSHMADPMH